MTESCTNASDTGWSLCREPREDADWRVKEQRKAGVREHSQRRELAGDKAALSWPGGGPRRRPGAVDEAASFSQVLSGLGSWDFRLEKWVIRRLLTKVFYRGSKMFKITLWRTEDELGPEEMSDGETCCCSVSLSSPTR